MKPLLCKNVIIKAEFMEDLEKYIEKRKQTDPKFAKGFENGFEKFKIEAVSQQAREEPDSTKGIRNGR